MAVLPLRRWGTDPVPRSPWSVRIWTRWQLPSDQTLRGLQGASRRPGEGGAGHPAGGRRWGFSHSPRLDPKFLELVAAGDLWAPRTQCLRGWREPGGGQGKHHPRPSLEKEISSGP